MSLPFYTQPSSCVAVSTRASVFLRILVTLAVLLALERTLQRAQRDKLLHNHERWAEANAKQPHHIRMLERDHQVGFT